MDISVFFPIWNKLGEQDRKELSDCVTAREVKKGTVLHNGSMDCAGLLLLRSGQLRGYILSEEGREITIYRLFERDFCLLSASCIMNSIQFEIVIQAEKDTSLYVIPPEVFKRVMDRSAPMANFAADVMGSRLSEAMWRIEQIMWKSLDKRVAAFLVEEANLEGTEKLAITHETVANHLGTHREVVTRMLRYFQSEGMVKLSRGSIELTDTKALEELCEG